MIKILSLNKFFFILFLLVGIIPYYFPSSYQNLTWLNYAFILPFLLILNLNIKKINALMLYLFFLFILSYSLIFLGYSGTVMALISAAIVPIFLSKRSDFILLLNILPLFRLLCMFLIFAQFYIVLILFNSLDDYLYLGSYFGIASINYVTLYAFGFNVLFFLIIRNEKKYNVNHNIKLDLILLLTSTSICLIGSYYFETRLTLVGTVLILIIIFNKLKYIFYFVILFLSIIYFQYIKLFFLSFSDYSFLILLISDDVRFGGIYKFIVASTNFNYNFRDIVSFSSLINLIFSLFPFTLIFLPYLIIKILAIIKKGFTDLSLLIVYMVIVCIYQMDFMSVFVLFFGIEIILCGIFRKSKFI